MNGAIGTRRVRQILFLVLLSTLWSVIFIDSSVAQDECADDENLRLRKYSLYYEYWKSQNFEDALPFLRWILRCAPGFQSNSDRNYKRAVDVYEGIGMASEDANERTIYLDSALYIHDIAVPNLQDVGIEVDAFQWKLNKGRFIQNHAEDLEDLQDEVGAVYRQAFDLDRSRLESYYINFIISDCVQRGQKTDALEFMDLVEVASPDNTDITNLINQWRRRLFTSPEEWIDFLEDQLENDPDNLEILIDLFNLFVEEQIRDKAYELSPRLLELDPTARTYRRIAMMRLEDGDSDEAIELFNRSLQMEGGQEAALEVHFNIGIAHQQEGRLSRARTSFRETLRADPNFGDAMIAIGDLYVAAVQGCDTFDREDKAVYWLAADYYDRAAARDERVADQARGRLAAIRPYFPTTEVKFFEEWETGESYTVDYGCYTWIGETTRIR